jgi:hypothetical protein
MDRAGRGEYRVGRAGGCAYVARCAMSRRALRQATIISVDQEENPSWRFASELLFAARKFQFSSLSWA